MHSTPEQRHALTRAVLWPSSETINCCAMIWYTKERPKPSIIINLSLFKTNGPWWEVQCAPIRRVSKHRNCTNLFKVAQFSFEKLRQIWFVWKLEKCVSGHSLRGKINAHTLQSTNKCNHIFVSFLEIEKM